MEAHIAQNQGLPTDISSYDMRVSRHALDAMKDRGIAMLDVVSALRASPDKVRRDVKTGHYVIRDEDTRIVVQLDSETKNAVVITVFRGQPI